MGGMGHIDHTPVERPKRSQQLVDSPSTRNFKGRHTENAVGNLRGFKGLFL